MATKRTSKALISTQRLDESVTRKNTVIGQVKELFPRWRASCNAAIELEMWYRNDFSQMPRETPHLPDTATADLKELRDSSSTPWGKMIADAMRQNIRVDGIRMSNDGSNAPATRLWQQNGLDSKQSWLTGGAIVHGKAYNLVGQATGRRDGKPTAFIRPKSAMVFDAFFRDDADEFPECALEGRLQVDEDGSKRWRLDFYDEVAHHRLTCEEDGAKMTYIDFELHPWTGGIAPVLRGAGNMDAMGHCVGEIEPYVSLFKRINQDTMDRLVVQRFGAFIVRWIAGIAEPKTDSEKRAAAMALVVTDLLVSPDKDTKFGSLPATPLDGYIRSREADIRDLSAVSQTPSFHMLGLSDNVGAEGLAAAEASHFRKCEEWKVNLGETWEFSLRLAGQAAGDQEIADDFESRIHFKDTSAQSFQSLTQGLSSLATGLGLPWQTLVDRIPDWTDADTEKTQKLLNAAERKAIAEAAMGLVVAKKQGGAPSGGKPAGDAG